MAYSVPAGHRLRFAVSPDVLAVGLALAGAGYADPLLGQCRAAGAPAPRRTTPNYRTSASPSSRAKLEVEAVAGSPQGRSIRRELATGLVEQVFDWDLGGSQRFVDIDLESSDTSHTVYSIREGDPLSAEVRFHATSGMAPRRLEHALGGDERDDLRRARPSTSRRSSRSTSATRASSRARGRTGFPAQRLGPRPGPDPGRGRADLGPSTCLWMPRLPAGARSRFPPSMPHPHQCRPRTRPGPVPGTWPEGTCLKAAGSSARRRSRRAGRRRRPSHRSAATPPTSRRRRGTSRRQRLERQLHAPGEDHEQLGSSHDDAEVRVPGVVRSVVAGVGAPASGGARAGAAGTSSRR